jgi:hypothetical protein
MERDILSRADESPPTAASPRHEHGGPIISRPRGEKKSKAAPNPSRWQRWTGPAILLAAAVIAIAPLLWHGAARGGDFGFHFISWIDARQSILMGALSPHWAYSPNFGAGEPRFLFYPPLSILAGAFLGMFFPWSFVPLLFSILLLAATGLSVRALARETLPDGPATLAGCAAIFLGYPLFNIYKRCDYAEMLAAALIPLLLLFALRRRNPAGTFWERTFDGSAAPLALVIAGIWLSNGPVGIMAGYLLAAVALVCVVIEKSLVPLVRAAAATIAGMALAAFYLIPAVAERNWASIQYAFTLSHFVVENSWLFARHADPDMISHDSLLLWVSLVAVEMLAVAFLGAAVIWMRGVIPGPRRWWLPLALIPPAVLFLLLPISHPVWNLPELRLLQFPWRWLVVLEAPMGICFAVAVWAKRKGLRIFLVAASAVLFVGISLAASQIWFLDSRHFQASILESVREGAGVLGKPEYAPPGTQLPLVDHPIAAACLLDAPSAPSTQTTGLAPAWDGQPANCSVTSWHEALLLSNPFLSAPAPYMEEDRRILGVAAHPGYLILRLRAFPAWAVTVNGTPVTPKTERARGFLAVPVPQGNVQVTVDWTTTRDVVAGRLISAAALLFITGLYLFERKRWRLPFSSPAAIEEPNPRRTEAKPARTGSLTPPPARNSKPSRRK